MKTKKFLSLLLVGIMLLSFAACGGKNKSDNEANELTKGAMPDSLMVEKVGSLTSDDFSTAEGGLYYQDEATEKYGVMSLDGNYDTGAVYVNCTPVGLYFKVSKTGDRKINNAETLNDTGLIDGKGKVLVPEAYAYVQSIGDRYFLAIEATNIVGSKDRALVAYDDRDVSKPISATLANEEEDFLFAGKWYVYDKTTGKMVPGISGTADQSVVAYGNFIAYNDDEGNRHVVDANGKELVHNKLFDDGSYTIEGKIGTVYDTTGEKLFDYDLASYIPKYVNGNYYTASVYKDGTTAYVVMDKTGKVLSTEFTSMPSFYGDLVLVDNTVYDVTGKKVIKGSYESISYNSMFGDYYFLRNNETYTLINSKGDVLFEDTEKKNKVIFKDEFVAYDKSDDNYMFYSYKDADYTIEGYSFAPWLVKTASTNNLYNIVNVISGETVLENYNSYTYTTVRGTAYYVYAKYNGGTDIYLIVNEAQLKELMDKKDKLLSDLIASFEKEGITVTVNKETGELAMDSSVLFGGDSAELTADGKAFLDKFVKAYTSIAYSEEYDGFISKTFVEGHTAPTADATYASDMQLSVDRATNVKNYCVSTTDGAAVKRFVENLEAVGYSNSQPVYGADGNVDMAASRRVSFRFMLNIDLID